ncbi:hypothetical protein [Methanolobus sp. WCC5]|uniref:hypothetical protein n=1 Tax=Methanolobus sp. WCC5 TaxID=3125785 RepID=UPI00324DE349
MNKAKILANREFDEIIAILGIVFSVALIAYMILNIGRIIYVLTGIFTLISCILWIVIRKNASLEVFSHTNFKTVNLALISAVIIVFIFCVLSFFLRSNLYERPITYFLFISLMCCFVTLQILYSKIPSYLVLFQIIVIGLTITLSQLLLFPGLLGIDPWVHQMFTLDIIKFHTIPDGNVYSKLPLFHLFVVFSSLVTELDYKYSVIFSLTLIQTICNTTFIYLIGRMLFNDKVGLLGSLMLIIANHHLFMMYSPIPNSYATTLILILFYTMLKIKPEFPFISTIISIMLIFAIILSHSVAALFMCICLFVYWSSTQLLRIRTSNKKYPISLTITLTAIISMLAWWSFASGHIYSLTEMIKWGFSRDYFIKSPDYILEAVNSLPIAEEIFNNVGMFLFFALSFIGCFYMISKKYGNQNTFAISVVGFTPLFLGFFSLITQRGIIEDRWWFFAQVFLSIPLSVSLLLLYNSFRNKFMRHNVIPILILIIFMFSFSFVLVMSPKANMDNNVFSSSSSYRLSLTESEIQSLYTISEKSDSSIGVDQYLILASFLPLDIQVIPINEEIDSGNFNETKVELILVRNYIIDNPFQLYTSTYNLNYNPLIELENRKFNKIYQSNSVNIISK